ncbi:hypothetical protein [Plesiomonas shigelloides]|uniref:hypothetical protein n=1 Tax=Plesiomonas shigelloides TaxID=703 RepID=UPI0012617C33|nr:hypothetical protein [Plesiomonas shigelloides]KAB7698187.1 hypothetical protein GBN15_06660 [Plesiomonas shigelloides]
MLPLQEIKIKTKNNREFYVHLEKWAENHFDCKLAAINLGPQLTADAVFGPFANGKTASDAFKALIQGLTQSLSNLDATDSVAVIDNPCNTEFIKKIDQETIVGSSVSVLVNGK